MLKNLRKYKNVVAIFFVAIIILFSGLFQNIIYKRANLNLRGAAYISSTVLPDDGIQQSSSERGQSQLLPGKDLHYCEGGLSLSHIKLAIFSSENININKSPGASLSEKWIRNRMIRI